MQKTIPGIDWRKLATYNLERTVAHGARRAAEMYELAATVAELGLDPFVTEGIAKRIEWAHEQLKGAKWAKGAPQASEEVLQVMEAKLAANRRSETRPNHRGRSKAQRTPQAELQAAATQLRRALPRVRAG